MEKICSCYRPFNTWNPWRRLCDRCREQRSQDRNGNQIVLLDVAGSEIEASIWRDLLSQEGIPAMLGHRNANAGLRAYGALDPNQGYEVRVFQRDLDAAWQVIKGDGARRREETPGL